LRGGAAEVISDGDSIRAIEIGVGCVRPGTGGGVDRGGAIAGCIVELNSEDCNAEFLSPAECLGLSVLIAD